VLPEELKTRTFLKLSYLDNVWLRGVCRSSRDLVGGENFRREMEKLG
jgi:hypothetical protein